LEGTVTELVTTGRSTVHQELKSAFPASLLDMAAIPGLGPKKLKAIYDQLGISTVGELEYACIENRLMGLQGFGQKSQEKILAGIRQYKRRQGFHLYANVIEMGDGIYGIEAASRAHFSVPSANLTQTQSSLLAAMLPNPRRWNPREPSRRLRWRQQHILRELARDPPVWPAGLRN